MPDALRHDVTHLELSKAPLCGSCGYSLRGLGDWLIRCPECGAVVKESEAVDAEALATRILVDLSWVGTYSLFTLLVLLVGLLALFVNAIFSMPFMILGVFLSLRAAVLFHRRKIFCSTGIVFICIMYGAVFGVECIFCAIAIFENLTHSILMFAAVPAYFLGMALVLVRSRIINKLNRSFGVCESD